MADALTIAVQSLHNDIQRIDNISQNLVNATTPGYKSRAVVSRPFADALKVAERLNGTGTTLPVTLPSLQAVTDLRAGTLKATGNPLDLAIVGDGFFEVSTEGGAAYTRAGSFHLDASGRIVTEQGQPLQGQRGDIQLRPGPFTVDRNGLVSQDGETVAQLKIVRFPVNSAATPLGGGLLDLEEVGTPVREDEVEIRTGFIENANVVPMREMVALMEATRHFEATQKLIQGYDESLQKSIQKLGEF